MGERELAVVAGVIAGQGWERQEVFVLGEGRNDRAV
jgi:hypothetical protein